MAPPLLHMHFRSSNVLLDENFTAKVSDYGLSKLLSEDQFYASSSAIDCFLDPEYANQSLFETHCIIDLIVLILHYLQLIHPLFFFLKIVFIEEIFSAKRYIWLWSLPPGID